MVLPNSPDRTCAPVSSSRWRSRPSMAMHSPVSSRFHFRTLVRFVKRKVADRESNCCLAAPVPPEVEVMHRAGAVSDLNLVGGADRRRDIGLRPSHGLAKGQALRQA